MPLQTFDTKDAVPDALRDSAIESKDGKFVVSVDEDVTPLKTALAAERKRAADEEKARKAAETARLELERKLEGQQVGLTEAQQKEFRDKVTADIEEKYKPLKEKAERFESLERLTLLDNPVKASMLTEKVGVRGERQEALWRLIGDRFDLTSDRKPMVKDHPGMAIEDYLAGPVKKEYPEFFKGTQAAGGGAGGATGAGGDTRPDKPPTQWTTAERVAFVHEHGFPAYQKLLADQTRELSQKKKTA